jgi:uncharacterized coiled-coil protein SlyX
MERERMSFEKEKSRAEEQMKALYERLNSLVSDAAQKAKRPPGDERRA